MPFKQLDDGEHVLSLEEGSGAVLSNEHRDKVHITTDLSKLLSKYLANNLTRDSRWIAEGIESRLLKVGSSGWVEGKVRFKVVVEFCPNEPEPPKAGEVPGLEDFPR